MKSFEPCYCGAPREQHYHLLSIKDNEITIMDDYHHCIAGSIDLCSFCFFKYLCSDAFSSFVVNLLNLAMQVNEKFKIEKLPCYLKVTNEKLPIYLAPDLKQKRASL